MALGKKIAPFKMWYYSRIMRIWWTRYVANERVLQRIGRDQQLLTTVKQRKIAYFGRIMRNAFYNLQEKLGGKRGPGSRRISWLTNMRLRQWTGKACLELFRAAVNEVMCARMIDDVQ